MESRYGYIKYRKEFLGICGFDNEFIKRVYKKLSCQLFFFSQISTLTLFFNAVQSVKCTSEFIEYKYRLLNIF